MSNENVMSDELIRFVSSLVSQKTGIILGDRQKGMVHGRISRRVREVGVASQDEYLKYLKQNLDHEAEALVSLLTTHHTFFFREYEHFDHVQEKSLPRILEAMKSEGRKTLRVLSAACSRGHEVYSLAMFLQRTLPPGIDFEVVGGDVCAESVQFAKNGVYKWDEVKTIPAMYLQGNWARGKGAIADFVKVTDALKSHCKFDMMNLIEMGVGKGALAGKFDLIFCRNVFIYFEREQVKNSSMKLLERLQPCGDLIIGLSESLNGLDLPISWEGPSVYRWKTSAQTKAVPESASAPASAPRPAQPAAAATPVVAVKAPPSIFAVDDSPTVLKLIEKMSREAGFTFLGTAKDGAEALRILTGPNAPQPSVITLDLHMPNMNGLEFLKAFRALSKTPVIVVSSINREEQELAQQALRTGANDYVQKPAMDRWKETTSELIAKIKVLSAQGTKVSQGPSDLDQVFSATAKPMSNKRRWILMASASDLQRAADFAKANASRVEMIVYSGQGTPPSLTGVKVSSVFEATRTIGSRGGDFSVLIFGDVDEASRNFACKVGAARVLLEETSRSSTHASGMRKTLGAAFDHYPVGSFAYEADRAVRKAA